MVCCSFWNGEESGELWTSDEDMDVAALTLPSPRIMSMPPGSALNAALDDMTCFGTLGDLTSFDHGPVGMGMGMGVGVSSVGGSGGVTAASAGAMGVGSMAAAVGMSAMGRGHGGVMMVHVSGEGELMLDDDKGARTDPQVFEDMLKVSVINLEIQFMNCSLFSSPAFHFMDEDKGGGTDPLVFEDMLRASVRKLLTVHLLFWSCVFFVVMRFT